MTGKFAPEDMISVNDAADLLMVTPRWIRELAKNGYVPTPEKGKVPHVAVVQGYIKFLKDDERRSSQSAEARRAAAAKAHLLELRIARESGELIYARDVETAFADILGTYRSELAGVPAASTRDPAIRNSIEHNLELAIGRCRERFRKKREELAAAAKKKESK